MAFIPLVSSSKTVLLHSSVYPTSVNEILKMTIIQIILRSIVYLKNRKRRYLVFLFLFFKRITFKNILNI